MHDLDRVPARARALVPLAQLARDAAQPLLAAAGMGGLVFALRGAPPLLAVVAGAAAYPILLRLLGGIRDEELRILRRIPATLACVAPAARRAERRS
jgi:hypothetical protein